MASIRPVISVVIREHTENAAFFWAQRDTLAAEEVPDTEAIAFVDDRLEANLDALRIAGPATWPFIIEAFEDFPEKGELFVMAHRALETGDVRRLDQAAAFARTAVDGPRGLCGAFAWLPPKVTAGVVRDWIDADDPIRIEAAIAALVAHGGSLGDRLPGLLEHRDERIRVAAKRFRQRH